MVIVTSLMYILSAYLIQAKHFPFKFSIQILEDASLYLDTLIIDHKFWNFFLAKTYYLSRNCANHSNKYNGKICQHNDLMNAL